ncbi:CD48 antigen-like isoform X2 [Brachyhypopomus gauderio]|uniref:CD48 antigen-like isoform X2 n=1 Tax=Brachyhypopomus gauderio TaxID=698409 RepID=UPI0040419F6C
MSSGVFRLVGSSIQLDVQHHGYNYEEFTWMFNEDCMVKYYSKYKDFNIYYPFIGRVKFNKTTHSLILMNLQKSDSGLYTARAFDKNFRTVAKYTLSVWDPVETPVLTAVPDHLSTDPDPCNITLTCRGHDLSVSTRCYNEICEEKEVTSPGGVTLFLSVRNSSSIICNISNPVSWNMSVMEMNNLTPYCHHKDAVSPLSGVSVCLLKTVLYSVVLILMVSAVITVHIKEKLAQQS